MMNHAKLLLVDDDASLRLLLRLSLAKQPVTCFEADNGPLALTLIDQLNPDLILLDISMPDMDGLTVLQEIRKKNRSVGVLMVSALNTPEWVEAAIATGADGFIPKPWKIHQIKERVATLLEQVRIRRQRAGCDHWEVGTYPITEQAPIHLLPTAQNENQYLFSS